MDCKLSIQGICSYIHMICLITFSEYSCWLFFFLSPYKTSEWWIRWHILGRSWQRSKLSISWSFLVPSHRILTLSREQTNFCCCLRPVKLLCRFRCSGAKRTFMQPHKPENILNVCMQSTARQDGLRRNWWQGTSRIIENEIEISIKNKKRSWQ